MKKKLKNPDYSQKNYQDELSFLMKQVFPQPSFNFVQRFNELLPNSKDVNAEGYWDDEEDYYSWGYALFGHWENGEKTMGHLRLNDWQEFYEGLEQLKENSNLYSLIKNLTSNL